LVFQGEGQRQHKKKTGRSSHGKIKMENNFELEILLPVHNEAGSIGPVINEIYGELSGKVRFRFIVCEDGSRDNTKQILRELEKTYPMKLVMSDERKGYSKAVRDGMFASTAPYLLCLDSDGQCDPKDLWKLWQFRNDFDMISGWRVKRADTLARKTFSRFFYMFYKILFHPPLHDPSSPFVLSRKAAVQKLAPEMRLMKQGFWWEYTARAYRRGLRIKEVPVNHRLRSAGETQVYKISKMPGIFFGHLYALLRIWLETR
jgi:dolichol-phosphate mannosyltransferase